MTMVATRGIRRGEEVTACYIEGDVSKVERQAQLRAFYLFDCACPTCTTSTTSTAGGEEEQAASVEAPAALSPATVPLAFDSVDNALELLRCIAANRVVEARALLPRVLSKVYLSVRPPPQP